MLISGYVNQKVSPKINFNMIEKYPIVKFGGAKARKIAHNIYHLLRGQVYIIEKKVSTVNKKYFIWLSH